MIKKLQAEVKAEREAREAKEAEIKAEKEARVAERKEKQEIIDV